VRTRDGQWTNCKIVRSSLGYIHSGMDLFYQRGTVATISDAQGNFTLENAPPGDGHARIEAADGKSTSRIAPVQVPAGETWLSILLPEPAG